MEQRWERRPDVVTTDLDDEVVLLDVSTGSLHSMNETGRMAWAALAEPATIDSIVTAITAAFEIDDATATADVERIVAELVAAGLVQEHAGS